MKKLFAVLAMTAMIGITSCGPTTSEPTTNPSVDPSISNPSTPDDPVNYTFNVNVKFEDGTPFEGARVQCCTTDGSICLMPVTTDATGSCSFSIELNEYEVHVLNVPEGYYYDDDGYILSATNASVSIVLFTLQDIDPNNGDGTPYNRHIVGEGLYNVTVNSAEEIVYYGFEAKEPGVYRVESWAEGIDTKVGDYYASDFFVPETTTDGDDDSGKDKNFSYKITLKKSNFVSETDEHGNEVLYVGARWTLGFSVKDVTEFPCTFPVVFMRIADSKEEPRPEVKTVKVTETLTNYPAGEGTLTSLKMDGSDVAVYNENDKFYHLGSLNGPVIVAKISKKCEFVDSAFSTIQNAGNSALLLNYVNDYTDFIAKYAEVCNEDGVYGVTEELRTFLDRFQKTHKYFGNGGWVQNQLDYTADESCYWMFAAYYYAA